MGNSSYIPAQVKTLHQTELRWPIFTLKRSQYHESTLQCKGLGCERNGNRTAKSLNVACYTNRGLDGCEALVKLRAPLPITVIFRAFPPADRGNR